MFNRKEYDKKYRKEHKEHDRQYRLDHKEKRKEYDKQRYIDNKEKSNEQSKQWRIDNPERYRENRKQWYENHPEKAKSLHKKHEFKRRDLGFNPLNELFEGADAHHINKDNVIYMPKELHRSISHCLGTWRNMDRINKLAMEYL